MKNISRENRIKRFNKTHNFSCDYSQLPQTIFSDTLLTITCNIHNHTYTQIASSHQSYKGCKKCVADLKHSKFSTKQTDYINYCVNKFGNKFDYSKVNYINAHTPIKIKCNNCNFEKEYSPNKHKRGKGLCLNCDKIHNTKTFIAKAITINENSKDYSYDEVDYKSTHSKVTIHCNGCNTPFEQNPSSHLQGSGCPTCNRTFHHGIETYRGRKTTLYYIRVNNLYKIGLTLTTIKKRYNQDKNIEIEVINELSFEDGANAYELEQKILKENIEYRYNGEPILKGGNSELFYTDINPQLIFI